MQLSSINLALRSLGADPYGRTFLADASTGLLLPGFTYTRSGPDLWCPQADGSLASFAANVIPREYAGGRWGFRFDPGWTQSLLRTHELGNAAWSANGLEAVVQDGVLFGGSASWKIVESATSNYRYTQRAVNFTAGQAYTITAVVSNRAGSRFVQCRFPASAFGAAVQSSVNPRSGASQALFGATVHPSVEVAGGWLVAVTAVATATASGVVRVQLAANQATADEVYLGDGVSGVNVWGVNVTNTSYPVPLTVAQGTAVTVPDFSCNAQLSALGLTLGSAFSVVADFAPANLIAQFGHVWNIGRTSTSYVALNHLDASAKTGARSLVNGSSSVVGVDYPSSTDRQRVAMRISGSGCKLGVNGALSAEDLTVSIDPALDRFSIGRNSYGSNVVAMSLTALSIVPNRALSDAELQTLSAFTPEDFGAVYILRNRDRYVRPGLAFARAAEVYEPQAGGSLAAYSGAQVPWGANGVRLDPGWVNYAQYSIDPTNGAWLKSNASISTTAAPHPISGGVICKLVESATTASHYAQTAVITAVAGSPYTGRYLLRKAERTKAAVSFTGAGAADRGIFVDLNTGAVLGNIGAGVASQSVEVLANGDVLISISETAPSAAGYAVRCYLIDSIASTPYAGDGVSGAFILAANHTNTAYPVPLTVAQGSAVTVPNPSLQGLFADIGALGSEYTIGLTYIVNGPAAGHVLRIDDGTDNSRSLFYANGAGALSFAVKAAGATVYNQSAAAANGAPIKSVARVKENATRVANLATLAPASGAMAMPAAQAWLRIGRADGGANVPAITVTDVWYVPTSGLSDAQLQALSTL